MGNALGPCAQAGLAIQRSFFAIAKECQDAGAHTWFNAAIETALDANAHSRAITDFRKAWRRL